MTRSRLSKTKNSTQRRRPSGSRRRGAAIVEAAISLLLFVPMVLGMVDLGLGVFKYHVLTQTTRRLARNAIVHGALADRTGIWGPSEVSVTADENNDMTDDIKSELVGWNLNDVKIEMKWIDGGNDMRKGDRVKVSMSAPFRPLISFLGEISLSSSTTMFISH